MKSKGGIVPENKDGLPRLEKRVKELEREVFLIGHKPKYKAGDRVFWVMNYPIMGDNDAIAYECIILNSIWDTDEELNYTYYYTVLYWDPTTDSIEASSRVDERELFASTEELADRHKNRQFYLGVTDKMKELIL